MGKRSSCPFCGSEETGVLNSFGLSYNIGCLKCGMLGPQGDSEEAAEKNWNILHNKLCHHCISRPFGKAVKKRMEEMAARMTDDPE